MRIHSISQIIAIPVLVWTAYLLYQMFYEHNGTSLILLPTILLAGLYVSHGYIDYWWLEKNPPEMEEKMKLWFTQNTKFYNNFSAEDRQKFEQRLTLYINGREFRSVGTTELKEIPFDIQNILASQVIRLTLGKSDYLLGHLERVYTYKHPFPTPNKKFLHTVEVDSIDGILILALDFALPGVYNPYLHYNIALHGYAEAYVNMNPHINWPRVNHYGWGRLELINGIYGQRIVNTLGYEELNFLFYHIVAFFDFSDQYEKLFFDEYKQFSEIFNQDPAHVL